MHDWENLRYFLAVAAEGTVSGAARELGVSHSTVLRRIENLEQSLDSRLFRKLQKGYVLTGAGESLYAETREVSSEIERAMSIASGQDEARGGILRISQPESGVINVYPLYREFTQRYPDITLEIHGTMEAHNLNQHEVDVALRISESPSELLIGRQLGTIKGSAYATKRYLDTKSGATSLSSYDWIVWQTRNNSLGHDWLKENVVGARIVMYAESAADVVNAICSDIGVGFMSTQEARYHDELVPLISDESIGEFPLWVLTHRDLRHNERVRLFMRFMAENIRLD